MLDRDREEIRRVFEEVYAENMRTKNIQSYVGMYTEDALWIPPNVPDCRGKAEIADGFSAQIEHQSIDPTFTAEEIEVIGDWGYVIGTSIATIYPDSGESKDQVKKFRALWLMQKEFGSWKIARQIWNVKLS